MGQINDIAAMVHLMAKEKGFHDKPRNTGEMLMLCVSELGEALEADRLGRYANEGDIDWSSTEDRMRREYGEMWKRTFENNIKDTFEDELADTVIRIMDLAESKGINLEWHIEQKMKYNATRPHKHGKKY